MRWVPYNHEECRGLLGDELAFKWFKPQMKGWCALGCEQQELMPVWCMYRVVRRQKHWHVLKWKTNPNYQARKFKRVPGSPYFSTAQDAMRWVEVVAKLEGRA